MSSPPQPPAPPSFAAPPRPQRSGFPWLACGIGCLVVVLLGGGAVAFVVWKSMQAFEQIQALDEQMAEANQRQRAARDRIGELDELHPSAIGEDPGTAELNDSDIEQYLRLHAALAEPLAAHEAVKARVREFEEKIERIDEDSEPSFREAMSVFGGMKDAIAAGFEAETTMAALIEEAAVVMESEGFGRTELRRLCAIVHWRFLGRAGFEELELTDDEASSLVTARAQVQFSGTDEFDPDYWTREEWDAFQEVLVEHRETIARLEAKAAAARDQLAPGTRAKLESRRADLEAISEADALAVLELTRPETDWDWEEDAWSAEATDASRGGRKD